MIKPANYSVNKNFIILHNRKISGLQFVILFFWLYVLIFLVSCQDSSKDHNLLILEDQTMGTFYSIKIVKKSEGEKELKYNQLKSGINNLLKQINQQMSTYITDSEISKFNRFESTAWYPISFPLFFIIQHAIKISEILYKRRYKKSIV